MDIKLDSILPFDLIESDPSAVFASVDKNGRAVLLKNNQPAYIISRYDSARPTDKDVNALTYTLQEAMKIVLSEAENCTMHASKLADEIFERKLYLQKNGSKALPNQVRARCSHYPEMFETLPGNFIKFRDDTVR